MKGHRWILKNTLKDIDLMKWVNALKENYTKDSSQLKQPSSVNIQIDDPLSAENSIKINKISEDPASRKTTQAKITKFQQLEQIDEI